jgi:hypothetical protein
MRVKFIDWKNSMTQWAENISASFKLGKNDTLGFRLDYYTFVIKYETDSHDTIIVSQTATGTEIDVGLSYLKIEFYNSGLVNFNLSLYQKGFFERILNSNKIKSGNNIFDTKFGIYCSEKKIATKIFSNTQVQSIFLDNIFLTFNIQRKKSVVTLRSMEIKIYEEMELQELLNNFILILSLIRKSNP